MAALAADTFQFLGLSDSLLVLRIRNRVAAGLAVTDRMAFQARFVLVLGIVLRNIKFELLL